MYDELKPLDEGMTSMPEGKLKIYSKKAIWGFSVFFTSIFGGVLLFQNLRDIGKKKEANSILILSIVFTVITIFIVNIPEQPKTSLSFLCNMAGGLVLTEYFFKKYFPAPDDYDQKKIWKPLIISLMIMIPFIWALIYAASLEK